MPRIPCSQGDGRKRGDCLFSVSVLFDGIVPVGKVSPIIKEQTKAQHDYPSLMLQVLHSTFLISPVFLTSYSAESVIVCAAAGVAT